MEVTEVEEYLDRDMKAALTLVEMADADGNIEVDCETANAIRAAEWLPSSDNSEKFTKIGRESTKVNVDFQKYSEVYGSRGMETVFASIVGYTVVAVEQEYVLGYFPSIELANAGYEQYSRLTSSCFRKAYTCKEKDFGKRDHQSVMMKRHSGGPQVVENYIEKIKYSKSHTASTLLVPATGKPVGILRGRVTRECSHGPERNKYNKSATIASQEKKFKSDHPLPTKGMAKTGQTKKLGCPAKVIMLETIVFDEHELTPEMTQKKVAKICSDVSNDLWPHVRGTNQQKRKKAGFGSESETQVPASDVPKYSKRIYVRFPSHLAHRYHFPEHSKYTNPIAKELLERIHYLMDNKPYIMNTREMKNQLHTFVADRFPNISQDDRAYYPNEHTIATAIQRHIGSLRHSKCDLENVAKLAEKWMAEKPGSLVYFRKSYVHDPVDVDSIEQETDDQLYNMKNRRKKKTVKAFGHRNMVFVYIYESQLHLWRRYGDNLLLDATYRTSRYALPLFMLAVKTNTGYQEVGFFVLQAEDADSIAEALSIVKKYLDKHGITVKVIMTDNCKAEAEAIARVFPEAIHLLCDFHRGQNWVRWLNTGRNGCVHVKHVLFPKMRKIAEANNAEEYDSALEDLQTCRAWEGSKKFQNYFKTEWLDKYQKWVQMFRRGLHMFQNTNNGLERLNQTLKHDFLQYRSSFTLSRLLETIVQTFVHERLNKYAQDNARAIAHMSSLRPAYRIPSYLWEMMPHYINECYPILKKAREQFTRDMIIVHGSKTFLVKSASSDRWYDVVLTGEFPSCSCPDQVRNEHLCKHLFALLELNIIQWQDIPEGFRNHPYFTPDYEWEKCINGAGSCSQPSGVVAEFCQYVDNTEVELPPEVPPEVADAVNLNIKQSENEQELVKSAQILVRDCLKSIESATYMLEDKEVLGRALQQLRNISEEISQSIGSDVRLRSDRRYKTLVQLSQDSRNTTRPMARKENTRTCLQTQPLPLRRSYNRGKLWRRREGASVMDSIVELYKNQHEEALLEQMWEAGESDETLLAVGELLKKFEEQHKTSSSKTSVSEPKEVAAEEIVKRADKLAAPPLSKSKRRELTCGIDYVRAIIPPYVLKDVDVLPLQTEAFQTDRLIDAYLTLLARRHSSSNQHVMHLHARFFTNVLNGKYMIDCFDNSRLVKKIAFSYPPYKDSFADAAVYIGAFNKGGHHWVFVCINNVTHKVTYIDPLGNEPPQNFMINWHLFCAIYNKQILNSQRQTQYSIKHSCSKLQGPADNTNCGLYTLAIAKKFLEKRFSEIPFISPIHEGLIIYDDIMEASTFSDQCSKCATIIAPKDFVMCHAEGCIPVRFFHSQCIPETANRSMYICEVCDPASRQDFCHKANCAQPFNDNCLECRHPGCRRYIHRECLTDGKQYMSWSCGICTVAVV